MSLDTAVPRSRRVFLGALLGGLGATVAGALGRPIPARAGTDGDVVLGADNLLATSTTTITAETYGPALRVANIMLGETGVVAQGGRVGLEARSDEAGVAVWARGGTDNSGIPGGAIRADGSMTVDGNLYLSRSGRATVASGRRYVDIDLRANGGLNMTPLCFANVMSYRPGVFVTMVRPKYPIAGKARIYLNKAPTADTYVAWLVLN